MSDGKNVYFTNPAPPDRMASGYRLPFWRLFGGGLLHGEHFSSLAAALCPDHTGVRAVCAGLLLVLCPQPDVHGRFHRPCAGDRTVYSGVPRGRAGTADEPAAVLPDLEEGGTGLADGLAVCHAGQLPAHRPAGSVRDVPAHRAGAGLRVRRCAGGYRLRPDAAADRHRGRHQSGGAAAAAAAGWSACPSVRCAACWTG